MLEEIVDSPFFAQSAKERKVAFVVLGLIVAFGISLNETLVDWKGVVGKQQIDDLDHALILKYLAVGRQCRQMQPRAQGDLVQRVAALLPQHAGGGDKAGDFTRTGTDVAKQIVGKCTINKSTAAIQCNHDG